MPVTNFIYDGDNVLMETDENNVPTVVYTHEPGPYGALISQNRSGVTSYVHYDGQGNVRQLTDSTGTATDTFDYNAFGEEIHRTGTTVIPFRWNGYVGYYWDTETKRYSVRRRSLSAANGRWTSVDPLGLVDGPNLYRYARNAPCTYRDPAGLASVRESTSLDCPTAPQNEPECGCYRGKCDFSISVTFQPGSGLICFSQRPGELHQDEDVNDYVDPEYCFSEINRDAFPGNNFTLELANGTRCKYTRDVFPPFDPWPPDAKKLNPGCENALSGWAPAPGGRLSLSGSNSHRDLGGCYAIGSNVTRVTIDFSIDVRCGCHSGGHNESFITLCGELP